MKLLDKRTSKGKRLSAETRDASMSVAHLSDTTQYDLSHAITHTSTALGSKDLAHIKQNLRHIAKHTKDALRSQNKIADKISKIPSVKAQTQKLKVINK